MTDLIPILRDFTPGAYGIWTGVLLLSGWMLKEWRETRKLSLSDRQARREGYEKQVQILMAENRQLHEDRRKDRVEYDEYRTLCHAENDALRKLVINLEGELAGFKRRVDVQGIEIARLKGMDIPLLPGEEPAPPKV